MVRWVQVRGRSLIVLAGAALLLSVALVGALAVRGGSSAPLATPLVVSLFLAALLALVVLLLADRTSDAPEEVPASTSCASCGRPIVEEWRLCPHCGQLLECDLMPDIKGGSTRG